MESIAKDTNVDLKEKKIIELAKKNSDLLLKNEKLKTQYKDLEKKYIDLANKKENATPNQTENKKEIPTQNEKPANNEESSSELKKKLKQLENKIVEMRNKNQLIKEENTKLMMVLKKEIGENIDMDKLLKATNEKTNWKGRAETIEYLRTKIKNMETQISMTNSVLNAEDPKKLFLKDEKIIYKNDPKKEKEVLKLDNDKLKEENQKALMEASRMKSRKDVLEKELKYQKEDFTNKN